MTSLHRHSLRYNVIIFVQSFLSISLSKCCSPESPFLVGRATLIGLFKSSKVVPLVGAFPYMGENGSAITCCHIGYGKDV